MPHSGEDRRRSLLDARRRGEGGSKYKGAAADPTPWGSGVQFHLFEIGRRQNPVEQCIELGGRFDRLHARRDRFGEGSELPLHLCQECFAPRLRRANSESFFATFLFALRRSLSIQVSSTSCTFRYSFLETTC